MKKYIVLSILLIIPLVLLGQEKSAKNESPQLPPSWIKEAREATESNYVETFADAFKDPNIFIGVFERSPKSSTTLSSGEILENLPGYREAKIRFSLSELRCVKPIKGEFAEPLIFVSTLLPPIFEGQPTLPGFIPPLESKWVLALQKTSKEYRISRFGGEDVERYKFINDHTMFRIFRYGHGALCLKWPDEDKRWTKPEHLVKVPESIVEDFEAIQRVMPYIQKEKIDPNEIVAIGNTKKALKTSVAKSIFAKVLSGNNADTDSSGAGR